MQKKIVALAVAGLSTAAFAQTNVTIYGVADVSGQGTTMTGAKEPVAAPNSQGSGSTFNLQSNSSLIGFKGTEDLGNGLKALFQAETTLNLNGVQTGATFGSTGTTSVFGSMRDTFVGMTNKYGTVQAGYISTPFRSSLNSFDVMPGATGSGQIENMIGEMRYGTGSNLSFDSSIRATAVAYAMPTLYGFNASVAYTGSNNNGTNNQQGSGSCATANGEVSACTAPAQSAWGFNLGWTGYGVDIKGAFQQANYNLSGTENNNIGDFTSYLVGATYTGIPGLKLSNVYVRNSLGTNGASVLTTGGAGKISNNQYWVGASYRMGNWEPAASAGFASDMDGSSVQQLGSKQWTARVGYYLSKRTQVYGIVSNMNNSANQNYKPGLSATSLSVTGGQNLFTYGMGLRTTF